MRWCAPGLCASDGQETYLRRGRDGQKLFIKRRGEGQGRFGRWERKGWGLSCLERWGSWPVFLIVTRSHRQRWESHLSVIFSPLWWEWADFFYSRAGQPILSLSLPPSFSLLPPPLSLSLSLSFSLPSQALLVTYVQLFKLRTGPVSSNRSIDPCPLSPRYATKY